MEGGTLSDSLTHYATDRRAAVRLLVDVARAVHHGHQRRCLHRDLKPGNILLDDDLRPHVTDFGLAAPLGTDMRLPATGTIEGIVGYMSPEQAVGDQDLTTASDIFALGAILHALLTGEPPCVTSLSEGSQPLTKGRTPEPLTEASSHTDRGLRAICLKCLKRDPDERYGSADALADDLKRWLDGKRPGPDPWPAWMHVWRWCKRNPLGTGLTATAAALAFAVTMAIISILNARERSYDIFEGRVETKSLGIKNELSHYQRQLEYLRGSATEVLPRVEPSPDQPVYPAKYFILGHERGPPDLLRSDVHGSLVSLEQPSVVEAPKTHVQEKTRQRLTLLGSALQRAMVRSPDSKIEKPPPAHDALIRLLTEKPGVPIAWAYVGLKSGIDCTYPGVGGFPDDYDPRKRPWYTEAKPPNRGVVWIAPYPDVLGMGRVLTCSAPIYDYDDRFLGVVGVDLLESFVEREMLKTDDPLRNHAFLTDGQGRILVSNVRQFTYTLPKGYVDKEGALHREVVLHEITGADWEAVLREVTGADREAMLAPQLREIRAKMLSRVIVRIGTLDKKSVMADVTRVTTGLDRDFLIGKLNEIHAKPLPAKAVENIKAGESGRFRIENKLVVYCPVKVSGWYYVVVADVDHIQKILDAMPRQQHDRPGSSAEK
jgi:serine/threonine protein kinase